MEIDVTNPEFQAKIMEPGGMSELLAAGPAEDEQTQEEIAEDASEAVESVEDEIEEETEELEESAEDDDFEEESESDEEEASDEDDSEDDEESDDELDPDKIKSVKHLRQQVNYEQQMRQNAEMELAQLKQAIVEYSKQQEAAGGEEAGDDEYLDEKAQKEIETLKAQQTQMAFQNALNTAEMQATQKYADFQDAYNHIQSQKAKEIAATSGIPEEQAAQQALVFMQRVAYNAFERNLNIGDTFYNLAKSTGYTKPEAKPAKKKTGINPKAIAKNRAKTEKKTVKSGAVDDLSNADPLQLLQKMAVKGRGVPMDQFKKLLAKGN